MVMKKVSWVLATLVIAAVFIPATATAESAEPCPENVICLPVEDIVSVVQRPRAFYLIDRQRLRHQSTRPERSFTNEILESIDTGPF